MFGWRNEARVRDSSRKRRFPQAKDSAVSLELGVMDWSADGKHLRYQQGDKLLDVEVRDVNDKLEISAATPNGTIMGLRHRKMKIEGVQFHPESIMTTEGKKLLANFLKL